MTANRPVELTAGQFGAGRRSLWCLPNDRMWCRVAVEQAVFDRATEPEEVWLLILPIPLASHKNVADKGDMARCPE